MKHWLVTGASSIISNTSGGSNNSSSGNSEMPSTLVVVRISCNINVGGRSSHSYALKKLASIEPVCTR